MKNLFRFLILLTVVFLLPLSVSAAEGDGLSFSTAITITDFDDFPVTDADGQKRYFKFTAPASVTYTIISVSDKRIEGTLYDADRKVFAENRNEVGDFEIKKKLTAGATYYLRTCIATLAEGETTDFSIQFSYEKTVDDYKIAVYSDHCTILRYNKSERIVTIPSALNGLPVTALCDSAFSGKTALQQVTIPAGIVSIGKECFSGCTNLDIVNFSEGLETIEREAFYNCNDLIRLTMPSTLKSIGSYCFETCTLLESVILNEGLESMGEGVFEECSSLKKITIPSTVTSFGQRLFYKCSALQTAILYNSMKTLPYATFLNCDSLWEDQIVLPAGIEEIGEKAFYGCGNLGTLEFLPITVRTIGVRAFAQCEMLEDVVLPEGVEHIGGNAFQDSGVTTLSLPSTLKTIDGFAFDGCQSLIRVELFDGVSALGNKVFYDCAKLRSVKCYNMDMTIGADCFTGVSSKFNLYVYENSTSQQYAEKNDIPYILMALPEEPEEGFVPEIVLGDAEAIETPFAVYENMYPYLQEFNNGYASVSGDGHSMVLDMTNTVHYSSAAALGNYAENIVASCEPSGKTITFTRLDGYAFSMNGYVWAGAFRGGKCTVMNTEGKYELIDAYGRDLLGAAYDDILYDETSVVLVRSETEWTTAQLPDESAAVYSRSRSSTSVAEFLNSDISITSPILSVTGEHIICSDGNAYGILTADNEALTEFKYDSIWDAENGIFIAYYDDCVDLIDLEGTVTATVSAYYVGEYSEGKLPCFSGENYRYINKYGTTVLTVESEAVTYADAFHEGHAVVYVQDKGYTYINTDGIIETADTWDYAGRFAEGYALVMTAIESERSFVRQWSIIDETFTTVMTLDAEVYVDINDPHSTDFSNGYIRTIDRDTGLMGFVRLDEFDFSGHDILLGDVNSDGEVNDQDGIRLIRYFAGWNVAVSKEAADVDADGILTRRDAMILTRYLTGWHGYALPYVKN